MQNKKQYREVFKFLGDLFSATSKSTNKPEKIDNTDLMYSDYESIQKHSKSYSDYLDAYVNEYTNRTSDQRKLRKCFFWIIMGLLIVLVFGGIVSLIIISLKETITITDVITAASAMAGVITSFLVLPKVIAENLFPGKEENTSADLFGKMFQHDIDIRCIYRDKKQKEIADEIVDSEVECKNDFT